MGEVERTRLTELATEINAEYRAFDRDFRSAAEHAIRCGMLLEEKKASLGHGEWLPWLRDHFEGSERHAQRFMKLAREQNELDPSRVSHLSLRGALRQLPSNAPSVADELADVWVWTDEDRQEFAALTETEKLLGLHQLLLFKYTFFDDEPAEPQGKYYRRVMDQLDRIHSIIRPIDLPEGADRRFCEEVLTYRQMHQTITELIQGKVVRLSASSELFESWWEAMLAQFPDEERERLRRERAELDSALVE